MRRDGEGRPAFARLRKARRVVAREKGRALASAASDQ